MVETKPEDIGAEDAQSVLRRKAGAGRPRPAHPIPGTQKGVRLALSRAGREIPGLDLLVSELQDNRRSLAEVLDVIPERALLAVLEGPAEGLGLVALAPPLLSGIVEIQTMGRLASEDRPARRPTRTDAAMTAGLIDKVMTELEWEFAESNDLIWAGGFRYASFLDDPRPLELLLDDIAYRVFSAEVGLAAGARKGGLLLVLPAEGCGPAPQYVREDAGPKVDEGAVRAWAEAMDEAVQGAEAQLMAVLHRLRLPLSALLELKPGDMLPVPAPQLEAIELEAIDGRRLSRGRLGQNRGMRAVRLSQVTQGRGAVPGAGVPMQEGGAPLPAMDDLPLPHAAPAGLPDPLPAPLPDPFDLPGAGDDGLPDLPMAPMAMPLDGLDLPGEDDDGLPPVAVSG